jgi:hypothetical protein
MSSSDPLTRQRKLLRALRQADALRLEAASQHKAGSAELQRAGLTGLLDRVRFRMPVAAPGVAPLAELDRFSEAARKAAADLHSAVDALLRWRQRRRKSIIAATIVSIILSMALGITGSLVYHRLWLAWHYQRAVLAIKAQMWEQAADEILAISERDSDYRELPTLIATYPDLLHAMESCYSTDWVTGKIVRRATITPHAQQVHSVSFSPDGHILASGSDDSTLALREVATAQRVAAVRFKGGVYSMAFSPDGHTIAIGSSKKTTILWDTAMHQIAATLKGVPNPDDKYNHIYSVAFSPDGTFLASGTCGEVGKRYYDSGSGYYIGCLQGAILLWKVSSGELLRDIQGDNPEANYIAVSLDGHILASDTFAPQFLFDLAADKLVPTLEVSNNTISGVAFSPDGHMLAVGGSTSVTLWDLTTGQRAATLIRESSNTHCQLHGLAFSPDGRALACGCSDGLIIWNVATGQQVATVTTLSTFDRITGDSNWVKSVAFSPDGRMLASGHSDGTITLWRVIGQTAQ